MRPLFIALSAACALGLSACADPSEVRALRARKASLEAELAVQRQLLADEALYRQALKVRPRAGIPLEPAEVTALVTKDAPGVAVSVERAPSGGLNVSFSGPATGARATAALRQLASLLPDVSLSQVSVGAGGFSARGTIERPGPPAVPAQSDARTVIPFTEARKLRAEVRALEAEVQAGKSKVGEELASRGPAALAAQRSPDRIDQQADAPYMMFGGQPPLATAVEITYEREIVTARGLLAPGRKVTDVFGTSVYSVEGMSHDGDRFELKLAPRATAR